MLGSIIGDIAGAEYEVYNPHSLDFEMPHYAATFTDDTVLTCATADALLGDGDFAAAYLRWYGWYRSKVGFGPRFDDWGKAGLQAGAPAPAYQSWGNGSAMRVSPIGWLDIAEPDVLRMAAASAMHTHDHPEAVRGAQVTAAIIAAARRLPLADRKAGAIETATRLAPDYDITTSIAARIERDQRAFDVTCRGCVPVAIRAVLEAGSVEEAVRLAIWHGGDTDTLGAIAGSMAEAVFAGVPADLAARFLPRLDDRIRALVERWHARRAS